MSEAGIPHPQPCGGNATSQRGWPPRSDNRSAKSSGGGGEASRTRELEDAAVVVTVLAALAANHRAAPAAPAAGEPRSFWGDPVRGTAADPTAVRSGPHGWWASGLPR